MKLVDAKRDIKLYKSCVGIERKFITAHRNEVLNGDYASINKNIQINIAKLRDALEGAESEEEHSESN